MGLDMYLTKETYIGAHYQHRNVTGNISIKIEDKEVKIDFNRISDIKERVGYWRKANQIHNWFVQNVQDGKDDCGEYDVSKAKVNELLSLCKGIKEKQLQPEQSLPTVGGFFFGGTEYDEYYMEDIDDTIAILEGILKEAGDGDYFPFELNYRSSW